LAHRIDKIQHAFATAIKEVSYQGNYTYVYPIKTNQQNSVIKTIVDSGKGRVGLEVGSKPELIAVLGFEHAEKSLIICNGYKDRQFIHLALMGQRLGKRVYIILEKLSELSLVIEESRKLQVRPQIGIRVRLASMGGGKWKNTAGEKAKFGFSASQVLDIVDRLTKENMLDCMQILHYHLGSQVANIHDIQKAMRECSRFYCELRTSGVNITTIDVGGGLGVDYEGTHTRSECSTNYSIQEYADNIIYTIIDQCNEEKLPHPDIITESGRALVAYHGVIVTDVIGCESFRGSGEIKIPADNDNQIIKELSTYSQDLCKRNAIETYHHCKHQISESLTMFNYGLMSLSERALAEKLYLDICYRIQDYLNPRIKSHREIWDELVEKLADKYFCNLSIFQSLPDTWAIDQVLPIMPLEKLREKPDCHVRIQDITCDSDGCIDYYTAGEGVGTTILLPDISDSPYLLGFFLVGAYQEILGDMHNLFGDTDSASVQLSETGYEIMNTVSGDKVVDMLTYVDISAERLVSSFTQQLDTSDVTAYEYHEFLRLYKEGITSYTYLVREG
jgi:arginine decarboxylase